MARLIVKLDLGDVRISRYKDGRCWCREDPVSDVQTFSGGAGLMRDEKTGKIVDNGTGVEIDILWDSAEAVRYKGLEALYCADGHYYVTRSESLGG